MEKQYDLNDKYGKKIGTIKEHEPTSITFLFIILLIIAISFLSYFIWPITYKEALYQLENGNKESIITMCTTMGGILLGCIGSIIWTFHECTKEGPGKIGMIVAMMTGAPAAAIGSFCTAVGITSISFIILGIITNTFNWWEFILLLIMLAIITGLLCIIPVIITAIVDGIIILVYDLINKRKQKSD